MEKQAGIKHAVIPAAGLGTRFLPATKAIPKEMLPVVDKPAIQYVVEEAYSAGFSDLLLITGHNKGALVDHFSQAPELEQTLHARGDAERLAALRHLNTLPELHTVRQESARGLGDAVLTAANHVGDAPFAVLLGDDLIEPSDVLWKEMLEVHASHGGSVLALMEVSDDDVSKYGIAAISNTKPSRVLDLVEKPSKAEAPSNYAIIGRYILSPAIFSILRHTSAGKGGEVQLTDAIATLARDERIGGPVHAVVVNVRRFDTGDRLSYLKTVVEFATRREDLGPDFVGWLKGYVRGLDG
ncbi:MAG: UTP--glucose-phosphate uridylyltransferase GalU [Actinomycetota bacterium]